MTNHPNRSTIDRDLQYRKYASRMIQEHGCTAAERIIRKRRDSCQPGTRQYNVENAILNVIMSVADPL